MKKVFSLNNLYTEKSINGYATKRDTAVIFRPYSAPTYSQAHIHSTDIPGYLEKPSVPVLQHSAARQAQPASGTSYLPSQAY